MSPRIIFHIDMNAFFASVEQQSHPYLRGKAIGVGGKPGTRSIIAAASREAKLRGVKGIMNAHEALRICPELMIVDGDSDSYADVNRKFVSIFQRYTHLVEVFSIDECWLDMTGYARDFDDAKRLARAIKADMRREIGEYITCSVGIAPNKLLAKLASDKEKPNGLFVIRPSGVTALLKTIQLDELLGIGPRIAPRLHALGIRTCAELGTFPLTDLTREFGILGYAYHNMGLGIDRAPVQHIESLAKSIGNSYTMPNDSNDPRVLKPMLFALCEKVGRRLRRHGCLARRFSIWGRHKNFEGGFSRQSTLDGATNDAKTLLDAAWPLFKRLAGKTHIRALGITTHELIHSASAPYPLWLQAKKRLQVAKAYDQINDWYGERTIAPGAMLKTRLSRHVSGFKHGQNITPRTR